MTARRSCGLAALVVAAALLAGCAYPVVFVRPDPYIVVLLPGDRVTVTVTTDPPDCAPSDTHPDQPCVDVTGQVFDYVLQGIPAGVTTSVDTALQSPSTPGVVRITFEASDTAQPGSHEVAVHATLAGRTLGTAALRLRILSPAGPATTAVPRAIAGGTSHSLVALEDGTLLASGSGDSGQLGLGDHAPRATPTAVPVPIGVRAVAAGQAHSLAIGVDGSVWAWGENSFGQIGLGAATDEATRPRQVPGLRAHAVAAGTRFSIALVADSTVWSWGSGAGGGRDTPGRVEGLTDVRAIAAGANHALALRNNGTVWAWGQNDFGQAGLADPAVRFVEAPLQVPGLTGIVAVAAGVSHSLAVGGDGSVWAWGRQIAEPDNDEPAPVPTRVPGLGGMRAVAAGHLHALALGIDGTVWAWGRHDMLGAGLSDGATAVPLRVANLSGVAVVAAGPYHSLAAVECGQIWGWGHNFHGELGDPAHDWHSTPVPVADVGHEADCPRVALRVSIAGEGEGRVTSSGAELDCAERECVGVLDRGFATTLTAAAFFGSAFEGWAVDCQGPDRETSVVLDATALCVARFGRRDPTPLLLTVLADGGHVTGSGGGVLGPDHIDCGPTCSAIFPQDTLVTLTASDAGGFGFTGWGLDCGGTARETPIVMDTRHTCRADYRPFTLAVSVGGGGRVTSDPPGLHCGETCSYAPRAGTAVLRAEPAPGWQLEGWGGDCTGASVETVVAIDADRACTATFGRIPGLQFLTVIVEGTGSVTSAPPGIDCPGECLGIYPAGTVVDLTAVETPESFLLGWFDDCAAVGLSTVRVVMDSDRTCRARFSDRPPVPVAVFTFDPGPHPVGRVITFDGSASHVLDPVTGIQDLAGIRLFGWDLDGDGVVDVSGPRGQAAIVQHAFQGAGTHTVTLRVRGGPFDETADRLHDVTVVNAAGALRALSVEKAGDGEGTLATSPPGLLGCGAGCTSAGPVQLEDGAVVTLAAEAAPGSRFTGWTGGGCTSTSASVSVAMSADRTCTATFMREAVTLTVQITAPPGSPGRIIGVSPPGNPIDCGSSGQVCAVSFPPGTTVSVRPSDTSLELALFGAWAGCDAVGGLATCTVTLTGDRTVTATFVR
jgi:alpha-tubulin suppressor-like RCC1 family protein